jgi:hypothetical protein
MVFQNRCSGRCSSVGVCSIALASWTAVCWAPAHVEQDASGDQRAGPFEDGGDDQGGGLVAAGGAEDQDRVAVLGGQQPPEGAGGATQDHPAGLGLAHGQQPQLATARPHRAGMLGRPGVTGAVAGGTAWQMMQDRGGAAGQAGDETGEGGVHAGRAGQGAAHVGGPGQGGVAPVLR